MIAVLLALPFAGALLAFLLRHDGARRVLLVYVAATHLLLTSLAWRHAVPAALHGWLALDSLGLLVLTVTSALFMASAVSAVGYLAAEPRAPRRDMEEGFLFVNEPEAIFTGCLLLFLGTMTLVSVSQHFGLLWVGVEATTLATAPLLYHHRHHRSLEAVWKYLILGSVGIALALLGTFFLAIAGSFAGGSGASLKLDDLLASAARLDPTWLKAAFLFFLVGYGTKMGLAPMHTWLPDAHSEAPSLVSALLSGALLNTAFLALLRAFQVCGAAGLDAFARSALLAFGLVSLVVAAVFLFSQTDYKRLLAYSSVEHMGLLAIGVGIGGGAIFGALLHLVNHAVVKAALFLLAGNILAVYGTKETDRVRGVLRRLPLTGALWLAGIFAILGMPPFGVFWSKFLILRAAVAQGRFWLAAAVLALLAAIFAGMLAVTLRMAQGTGPNPGVPRPREPLWRVLPPLALLLVSLWLGLTLPDSLTAVLHDASLALGGAE